MITGLEFTRGMATVGADTVPFDEVYRLHAPGVYRYCLSQLGDPAAAEDVAADVFTAAFAAYARVRPDPDGVRPWLYTIARHRGVDHRRRLHRGRRAAGALAATGVAPPDVEQVAHLRGELRAAVTAIAGLRRRDRTLIGLRIAAGLSFAEIAAVLGTTEPAAKVATHRALDRLRARLADEGQP